MGNISLHATTGTTVQSFLLEGPKLEFCNAEYEAGTAEPIKENTANCVKSENETNIESAKIGENPSLAFQNNTNPVHFNSETSSSNSFSQPSDYNFQSYS